MTKEGGGYVIECIKGPSTISLRYTDAIYKLLILYATIPIPKVQLHSCVDWIELYRGKSIKSVFRKCIKVSLNY